METGDSSSSTTFTENRRPRIETMGNRPNANDACATIVQHMMMYNKVVSTCRSNFLPFGHSFSRTCTNSVLTPSDPSQADIGPLSVAIPHFEAQFLQSSDEEFARKACESLVKKMKVR